MDHHFRCNTRIARLLKASSVVLAVIAASATPARNRMRGSGLGGVVDMFWAAAVVHAAADATNSRALMIVPCCCW